MNEFAYLSVVITPLLSYLLGAVPFGLIISRAYGFGDIRKLGSGNIGATNVWRVVGVKAAIWVFIADIGKGVIAVLLAKWSYSSFINPELSRELFLALCGLAAVVGHIFPIYLKFKGGKGVNTALGAIVTLLPIQTFISLLAFIVTVSISRYISLGSIVAAIALSATLLVQKLGLNQHISTTYLVMAIIITCLVIITHHNNISRIFAGTESRFSFSSGNNLK